MSRLHLILNIYTVYIYIYICVYILFFFLHYSNENCEAYVLMKGHENVAMQINVMVAFYLFFTDFDTFTFDSHIQCLCRGL